MAAKTTSKIDPSFTSRLAQVQPALAAWRRRRRHREPIPEAIWRALTSLARDYGVSPVAQALGVNYTSLKSHLVASATVPSSGSGTGAAPFVEVPMAGWPQAPQWVIELADRHGSKLTLRLSPGDPTTALVLAQGLWGGRA